MACMLLSNITKDEATSAKLLSLNVQPIQGLSSSTRAIDQLADVFVRGLDKKYNEKAEYHFLASVFANVTMVNCQLFDLLLGSFPCWKDGIKNVVLMSIPKEKEAFDI